MKYIVVIVLAAMIALTYLGLAVEQCAESMARCPLMH